MITKRWTEHFNELLNSNVTGTSEDISTIDNPLDVELEEPQPAIIEVELSIEKLKNNKVPGTDLIQAELIKHAGAKYIKHLHQFITKIWITETIPVEWNMSILCPIHKKGDITICSNYRGISLLNITYKILSNILFTRLSPFVENVIGDYQSGFRQGRSTVDQIFTVQQILEKCNEFGIETRHPFTDFKAAYDSIDIVYCYERATNSQEAHCPCTILIKIQNNLSDPIEIENGLQQDALACLLFNTALEKVIRDANINTRGTIFFKSVQILAYADDIYIIARTETVMKEAFTNLEKAAKKMHLNINQEKTKYMPVTRKDYVRI
jgi:sorting nexin-29